MKVKIVVMHDNDNYNNTEFSMDAMKKAEESIKNIPILAYTIRDENDDIVDFDEHNLEESLEFKDDGIYIDTKYIERPIGLIPESCNPRYEEIDGNMFFVVDGYIWKCYSNGSYKLIDENEFKNISMEIEVFNGAFDDSSQVYSIKDYQYLGITCLGDHVAPAMGEKCTISKYTINNSYKEEFERIYKEIYKIGKEGDNLTDEVNANEIIDENEESSQVDLEEKEFESDNQAEQSEDFPIEKFEELLGETPESIEDVYTKVKLKVEDYERKLTKLQKFKSSIEDEQYVEEVNNIVFSFEFDENEVKDVKNKALKREINLEELEKELYAIQGKKYLEEKREKKQYSKKGDNISIDMMRNKEKKNLPYDGVLE
jgi:hypothetical protein